MSGFQLPVAPMPQRRERPATPVVDRRLIGTPAAPPICRRRTGLGVTVTGAELKRMRAMRQEGHTLREIGRELNRDPSTVFDYTRDIPPPPGGWPKRGPTRYSRAEIGVLLATGLNQSEIARRLGCCVTTVHRYVHGRHTVSKRRPPQEARYRALTLKVCRVSRIALARMRGRAVPAHVSQVRSVIMWAARHYFDLSGAEIAAPFDIEPATASAAYRRIEAFRGGAGIAAGESPHATALALIAALTGREAA